MNKKLLDAFHRAFPPKLPPAPPVSQKPVNKPTGLKMAVQDGKVVLMFDYPVAYIKLPPETALALGKNLVDYGTRLAQLQEAANDQPSSEGAAEAPASEPQVEQVSAKTAAPEEPTPKRDYNGGDI